MPSDNPGDENEHHGNPLIGLFAIAALGLVFAADKYWHFMTKPEMAPQSNTAPIAPATLSAIKADTLKLAK